MHKIYKKNGKTLLLLLLLCNSLWSQKSSNNALLQKIANKTCECASQKELTEENFGVSIASCIIESMNVYKSSVEKYYGKNLIRNSKKMEELSNYIVAKMMLKCPEIVFSAAFIQNGTESDQYFEEEEGIIMEILRKVTVSNKISLLFSVKQDSRK